MINFVSIEFTVPLLFLFADVDVLSSDNAALRITLLLRECILFFLTVTVKSLSSYLVLVVKQ
jgi:hypothetical protein